MRLIDPEIQTKGLISGITFFEYSRLLGNQRTTIKRIRILINQPQFSFEQGMNR